MEAFPPAPQPIGIFDQFIARQTETVVVDEKVMSLSGDSFDIKLANGFPLLRVQGNALPLRGRKEVFDMANNHLFTIVNKLLSFRPTFLVENPSGQTIMEVKSSLSTRKLSISPPQHRIRLSPACCAQGLSQD
jgi:uncharacterized protein YxjI